LLKCNLTNTTKEKPNMVKNDDSIFDSNYIDKNIGTKRKSKRVLIIGNCTNNIHSISQDHYEQHINNEKNDRHKKSNRSISYYSSINTSSNITSKANEYKSK